MRQTRVLKSVVLGLAVSGILMASAHASRTTYHRIHLPGVDHYGNLSRECGGSVRVKLVCDTRYHRFCATADGYVKNKSHHRQCYYDRLAVGLAPIAQRFNIPLHLIRITKDEYCVEKGSFFHHHRARCKAIVCGELNGNPRDVRPT